MSLALLTIIFLVILTSAYLGYGRYLSKFFTLNNQKATPASRFEDGVDFVPTKPFYLFGQHFSAIAAAGPIAGPILACQQFGWLPCLLWITFGVVFIGAVHDMASLIASVKHDAKSIAEIMRENMGEKAWLAMMIFIWISLIYVIIAFTDITAGTFVGRVEELEGVSVQFERGGAVAAASVLYLIVAMIMGIVEKKWRPPLWLMTIIFVPTTLGVVFLGTKISTLLLFSKQTWALSILGYCFVASLLPMWLLLQPRGYLGGFVLYLALFVGTIGLLFGGYPIEQAAFKTWNAPGLNGALFPFLFVTIACGACSGFHGLVCSGTTSKQIEKEGHCHAVGYGAMLLEAFVALIALATIMILRDTEVKGAPGAIYGAGLGRFVTLLIGKEHALFAITFGAMAFSTFVFDTLDVATRLGRYILQELLQTTSRTSAILATLFTVLVPAFFVLAAPEGTWSQFWILFGTSNQLMAALTLLGITVWLKNNHKPYWFTLLPCIFVSIITFWSLGKQLSATYQQYLIDDTINSVTMINTVVVVLLIFLAVGLMKEAVVGRPNVISSLPRDLTP